MSLIWDNKCIKGITICLCKEPDENGKYDLCNKDYKEEKSMTVETRDYTSHEIVNFKFDTVEDANLFALTAAKVGLKVKKNNGGKIYKTVEIIQKYK